MTSTLSLKTLMLRLFSGISGGLLGMVFALLVLFLVSFGRPENPELAIPYSMVTILGMTFVGTMISNVCVALFLSFLEPEKYRYRRNMLSQVFVFTFALFIFAIPFYLFASSSVVSTSGIHFLGSALLTALICEIMSGVKYSLTGLMGIIFSGCFLAGIFSLLFAVSENDSMLLILALPLAWICIPLFIFLTESINHGWAKLYGSQPLSPEIEK